LQLEREYKLKDVVQDLKGKIALLVSISWPNGYRKKAWLKTSKMQLITMRV
jgi:hypothetical protein